MANKKEPKFPGKKPDIIVNSRAKWIKIVENFLKQVDEGRTRNFPKISKKGFEQLDREEKTAILREQLAVVLKIAKISYHGNLHCPFHDDRRPSMEFSKEDARLHCFACHEDGEKRDLYDLIKLFYGKQNFNEQKLKAVELFVEDGKQLAQAMRVKTTGKRNNNFAQKPRPVSAQKAFSSISDFDALQDEDCIAFLQQRGITVESAKKFELKCRKSRGQKYLVISCEGEFVVRRRFKPEPKPHEEYKFWLDKGVSVTLFNGSRLDGDVQCFFVVESALDAIIIDQLGYPAVALNGKKHYRKLLEKAERIRSNQMYPILLLDNDNEGKEGGNKIEADFQKKGIRTYKHTYDGIAGFLSGFKDVGEAYMADPLKTEEAVRQLYHLAEEMRRIQPADHFVQPMIPNPLLQFGISDQQLDNSFKNKPQKPKK